MTKEELIKINGEFLCEHSEITDKDVEMCNKYINLIENTRDENKPKVGDILMYTNEHGDFYAHAHIDRIFEDGQAEICEQAYVPFISEYNGEIRLSTSGGAWCKLDTKKFKYVGKNLKKFCDWGHCGACAHGAIDFTAVVNVWEYNAENKFGEYSTKDYKKQHIHFLDDDAKQKRGTNYSVLGEGNAWETIEEYEKYKKLYNGVEFEGYWKNDKVLFTYKEIRMYVNEFQYANLPYKKYVILDNGSKKKAKISKDDENKTITLYFNDKEKYEFTNSEEWRKIRLYEEAK